MTVAAKLRRASLVLAIAAALPASASAELAPATQYAFKVAANRTHTKGCADVIDGRSNCTFRIEHKYTGWLEFPAACRIFMEEMTGERFERVPHVCMERSLFLLNHPFYPQRRFG
jgi:hypothetical protein